MGEVQARMESALSRLLPPAHVAPARLHEAMRYAVLGGGKRLFERKFSRLHAPHDFLQLGECFLEGELA